MGSLRSLRSRSRLLSSRAPDQTSGAVSTPEAALWWATLRQAAKDFIRGIQPDAGDAEEFLGTTGAWLMAEIFRMSAEDIASEMDVLKRLRSRIAKRSLRSRRRLGNDQSRTDS